MKYVTQDDLEKALLFRLFEHAQISGMRFDATAASGLLAGAFSLKRVDMALSSLERQGRVRGSHNTIRGSSYDISEKGYRQIEQALSDREDFYINFRQDGEAWLTSDDGEWAPAADRAVRFDHNQPEVQDIAADLDELEESVRGANDIEAPVEEKDRVVRSLNAARELWASPQLKIIQIKVGVLMAVQDAGKLLAGTSRAVAASLLVDAIKSFVKLHFGIDLDHI